MVNGPTSDPTPPIRFGTGGWRGVLGEDFTLPRLRALLHAVARWLGEAGRGREVLVGHDTRALGGRMADAATAILVEHGFVPLRAADALPTPVIARAVWKRAAAGGIVFTASHNPPAYHGIKVIGPEGCPIDDTAARRIESRIRPADVAELPRGAASTPAADLVSPYVRDLVRALDADALESSGLRVFYDAMHGTGAGVLDAVLANLGVSVVLRRDTADPAFGGGAPDPTPERLRGLVRAVRAARGLRLGVATDGDADRFSVVDVDGRVVSETEALAILVDHLARTGRAGRGVALSIAAGSLVERVARSHGLEVRRHPIGFKHLSADLLAGRADLAGDESGGFAWADFGRDKDGILASGLLAELVASTRAPLGVRLRELRERHGSSVCGRCAVVASDPGRDALAALATTPPLRLDGVRVVAASAQDGVRLELEDGFVMLRASGTEPVLRVYAEAPGAAALRRRLRAGAQLLGVG